MASPDQSESLVSGPPKDTFNLVYCSFFLLGMGYQIPWSTFITAIDYFELVYPTGQINRVFAVAYMMTALISILLLSFYGRNIPVHLRTYSSLTFSAGILVVTPAIGAFCIPKAEGTSTTYAITILCVAMIGGVSCITEGSIVGAVGELPPRYMQALMAGSAASGVLTSLLRLMSRAVMPQTQAGVKASAYLYFLLGTMIMLACIACYNLVGKLPMMQYYSELKRSTSESASLLDHSNEEKEPSKLKGFSGKEGAFGILRKMKPISYMHVWKKIQGLALSAGFVYVVTVSIYPGHVTEDFHSSFFGDLYPIFLTLCFYLSDVIGKCLPIIPSIVNRRAAIGGSLTRALFYPLFYLCLYGPGFFQKEVAVVILTCLVGFTNGYCVTIAMMLSPKSVHLEEAEVAGFLMVMLIKAGLAVGSIVEWVWIL